MSQAVICKRCGTCCMQGGPALHTQDSKLIKEGRFAFEHMVTIRTGELAIQPLGKKPDTVIQEFLKLQGKDGEWSCQFFEKNGSVCTVYEDRPVACRVLECGMPEALLTIVGKNLLSRFHLIDPKDPILPLVKEHESACPCPDLAEVQSQLESCNGERDDLISSLQEKVDLDLQYRNAATLHYQLPVQMELFYFGRPLFQLLIPLGIKPAFDDEKIVLA